MKVVNKRSYAVEIPDVGFVDPNEAIEVDDDLGESLILQVDAWGEIGGHGKSKSNPPAKGRN